MSEKRNEGNEAGEAEAPAPTGENRPEAPPRAHESAGREALIRDAAYARYQDRGAESGHEVEDWLAAEAEIEAAEAASDGKRT